MEKTILIVDDAMFMRKVIRKILEENGFEAIIEANGGEQALNILESQKIDLILLDITMPGMSGVEVLRSILEMKPDAKVVMCSAIGQEMMIQKAVTLGALDFIVKPFKQEEFLRIVNRNI